MKNRKKDNVLHIVVFSIAFIVFVSGLVMGFVMDQKLNGIGMILFSTFFLIASTGLLEQKGYENESAEIKI